LFILKWFFAYVVINVLYAQSTWASFLETYPHLAPLMRSDFVSQLHLSASLSPFRTVGSKVGFGIAPVALHYRNGWLDLELFQLSLGFYFLGGESISNHVTFQIRTAPKIQLSSSVSLGPLVGFEYMTFNAVKARIFKNNLYSELEPYSVSGFIWGGLICERFLLKESLWLQIQQTVYVQKFNPNSSYYGWAYDFEQNTLNQDASILQPKLVFLIEVGLFF
jgi:hypothetical protein